MKLLLIGCIGSALLCSSVPATAGAMSGNELFEVCNYTPNGNMSEAVKASKCVYYITGVADTLDFYQSLKSVVDVVCIPENVNIGQLQDVAVKHLRENPADRHASASSLVLQAWLTAFPCRVAK